MSHDPFNGINYILPGVAVFRERYVLPVQLQIAGLQGISEDFNLIAGIIYVEFPFHFITSPVQNIGQGVSDGAPSGIAHMQVAGGIGTDELHLHALSATIIIAISIAQVVNQAGNGIKPAIIQENIYKTRTSYLHLLQTLNIVRSNHIHNQLSQFTGSHANFPGHQHGYIAGKITVAFFPRDFYNEIRQ